MAAVVAAAGRTGRVVAIVRVEVAAADRAREGSRRRCSWAEAPLEHRPAVGEMRAERVVCLPVAARPDEELPAEHPATVSADQRARFVVDLRDASRRERRRSRPPCWRSGRWAGGRGGGDGGGESAAAERSGPPCGSATFSGTFSPRER